MSIALDCATGHGFELVITSHKGAGYVGVVLR